MENERPSKTYQKLYYEIIDELLFKICDSKINYCVRKEVNHENVPVAIWHKYETYRKQAVSNMYGERLDRHKLASCICGAIIEVKPLTGFNGAKIVKNANEILGLTVGLNIIKYYMMHDLLKDVNLSTEEKKNALKYLKTHFDMQLPPLESNICDTQNYRKNITNALYWSHHKCEYLKGECFHYDVWAYAKIFYHLEKYNEELIKTVYQNYCNS